MLVVVSGCLLFWLHVCAYLVCVCVFVCVSVFAFLVCCVCAVNRVREHDWLCVSCAWRCHVCACSSVCVRFGMRLLVCAFHRSVAVQVVCWFDCEIGVACVPTRVFSCPLVCSVCV